MRDETRDFSSLIPHTSSLLCGVRLHFSDDFQMGNFFAPSIIVQNGRVGNVHIVLQARIPKTNRIVINADVVRLVYQFFMLAFFTPMMASTCSAMPIR